MKTVFPLLLVLVAAIAAPGVSAAQEQASIAPAADVSLPFSCDWGYDWDERCWRDDSERLPVGGDTDKVWRAALRFALPPGEVLVAELRLYYDGTCFGPRKTLRRCDGRPLTFEAHPIASPDWFAEREVEVAEGPVATAELPSFARPQWLTWDITDLAWAWSTGLADNDGVLLQLAGGLEQFDAGGPAFPSSTFADPARRPRLDLWRLLPEP